MSPAEYRDWEKRYETPPKNRDELFQVMMDRLDDITHDIRHHDFNDRHKGFQARDTGASISFQEVIERLNQYAASLENEEKSRIRLDVFALDLCDPLAPRASAPRKVPRRSKNKL